MNPISGTRAKKDLQALAEKRAEQEGVPYLVFPSVASGNYDFLRTVMAENNTTDIVIAGGDGTVSQVVSSLMDLKVNFGILPCGSGNGLALAAGIPKKPQKALDIIFTGKPVQTDGFMINGQFACMLCGLGFDAKVAHDFANQPKRGLSTYVKKVISNFFSANTYRFELLVNGSKFETDAYFISIANSNQFGNNFTIAPAASLSDGLIDVVIVTAQNKLSFLVQTLRQVSGRNRLQVQTQIDAHRSVVYFQSDELSIVNHSQAPMHIDGDPAETPDALKIKVLKKCFRLLQPVL
ncbi:MAG TPA: diacylglycerol kinase family protein [Chitinophagaceae bacterium]|nr:diacylglycerol kinase family protein [Chitinophagaceae bacterium]